jgi:hypothetical protein
MFDFEMLIGLIAFGILYVAVIEILEQCEDCHAEAEHETRLHRHAAP